jgi:CheY-like chemotaxis protein
MNTTDKPLWKRTRILVVEDDPAARKLQCIALRSMSHLWESVEIVEASSIAEAELKIKSGPKFDAVILDLTLPNGRGIDTISRLSHAQSFPPSIVVLTGMDAETAYKVEGIRAGASGWVGKSELISGRRGSGIDWSPLESELAMALAVQDRVGPMLIGRAKRIAEEGGAIG